MLVCRIVFWLSLNILCCIQTMVVYKLFQGPEVSIAQGFCIFACRSGGMAGVFFSGPILAFFGNDVSLAMWLGAVAVVASLVATFLFAFLREGSSKARSVIPLLEGTQNSEEKPSFCQQVRGFSGWTWLLMVQIACTYGVVFPFEAIASDFFQETWGLSASASGMALSLAPFFGLFAWSFGLVIRGVRTQLTFSVAAWLTFLLAFSLLLDKRPAGNPIPAMCLVGIAYAYQTTCTWVLIPVTLREPESKNAATSITFCALSVTLMLSNFCCGTLHDVYGYDAVCIFLMTLTAVGFVSTMIMMGTLPAGGLGNATSEMERQSCERVEIVQVPPQVLEDIPDALNVDYFPTTPRMPSTPPPRETSFA